MARPLYHLESRTGDQTCQFLDQRRRRRAILVANDTQRGHGDVGCILGEIGIADGSAGAGVTLDRLADQHVAVTFQFRCPAIAKIRGKPALQNGFRHYRNASLGNPVNTVIPQFRRADPVAGVTKHKCGNQIGPPGADALGDHAADRDAAQHDVVDRKVFQQADQVADVIAHGVGGGTRGRKAMAAFVIGEHGSISSHLDDYVTPDSEIGAQRIDEDDQRLVFGRTDRLIVQRNPVYLGKLHGVFLNPGRHSPGSGWHCFPAM